MEHAKSETESNEFKRDPVVEGDGE